jgi:lipid-binding SYLF domain-containing protein
MDKQRRNVMITGAGLAVAGLTAAGCTTTASGGGDPAARRQSLDAAADSSLSRLYSQAGGSQELVSRARGVLVFPAVLSAGFLVGASTGDGVLRKGGKTVSFHRMTEASVGLLAGAQSQAVFMLFMTEPALQRFENSSGWTVGVDGSVALATVGADARVTTQTAQQDIIGFVLTNAGLMGNLSLSGNRITRLPL